MVGKFIAWLLRNAGYCLVTDKAFLAYDAAVSEVFKEIERLNEKLIELDSVICSTMECVEELNDKQLAVPVKQSDNYNVAAQILNEFLNGPQPTGRNDE